MNTDGKGGKTMTIKIKSMRGRESGSMNADKQLRDFGGARKGCGRRDADHEARDGRGPRDRRVAAGGGG
jgi:hypothetical protein